MSICRGNRFAVTLLASYLLAPEKTQRRKQRRPERDVEFLHLSSYAPTMNSKINKIEKHFKKFWIFFVAYFKKCLLCMQNFVMKWHFGALILFFLRRPPPMWFRDEILHVQQTFAKVCYKKNQIFLNSFLFYCSHQEHLFLGVEKYFGRFTIFARVALRLPTMGVT